MSFIIVGGYETEDVYYDEIYQFDPKSETWTLYGSIIFRRAHTAIELVDTVYVDVDEFGWCKT